MQSADVKTIARFVARYRRRVIAYRVAETFAVWGGLFFLLFALLQAVFALFPWTLLPLVLDIAAAALCLFLVGYAVAAVTRLAPRTAEAARMIERNSTLKRPFLSIALELASDRLTADNPFTGQALGRASAELGRYPAAPRFPRRGLRAAGALSLLAIWCFLNPVLAPRLQAYWDLPFYDLSRGDAAISPGSVVVPADASVALACIPRNARYPSCRLTITATGGERLSSVLLRPDSSGRFEHRLDSVRSSFAYGFRLGGSSLPADTVTVVPPPRLYGINVFLEPPAYTRKPARALPEGQGNFDAYAGSRASITIESDRLDKAWLVYGRDTMALATKGPIAQGTLQVAYSADYTFALLDSLGQRSDLLPRFHIGCIPDDPPSVQILIPGFNKELVPEQVETLSVKGIDDIGIRQMTLRWRLGGDRQSTDGAHDLSSPERPPLLRAALIWHLTELSLYPGDTVFYWAEARDTRPSGKPQTAVSDTFWFRIPGFEERYRRMAEQESRTEQTLGAVRDRQGDLQERLESVVKSATGRKELSWEQKQILRDVRDELAAQADSLRQSVRALEQNIERMKQEGTSGEEIAKKIDQVRRAVDDLIAQYGDSLLFNFKDLEKPVSWQDLRKSIERAAMMLPRLGEQLDNVLKFLEMLKQDRKFAELAMRAEQLSKEQAALSSEREAEPSAALSQEKDLLERIRQLSRDVAALPDAERAAAFDGLDSLQSMERLDSLRKAMQAAVAQRMLPQRGTMRRMSGALLSLSQDLMQMMNFNTGARMERERQRLLSLSRDAITLADWQEDLQRDPAAFNDPLALARSQQAIRDALRKARASAESLSMVPPGAMLSIMEGFKKSAKASERVIEMLGSGDGNAAMSQSSASLRSLANSALAVLSEMANSPESQGLGGGCMMPGLRKISGRQAALNGMTSDLLSRLFGEEKGGRAAGNGGGNAQGMDEARREARMAQQAIADELKKLAEKYGSEAGEGLTKKVADLEEEARRLAVMLERPVPEIAGRQDRFLARMLETTLSMHREGEGKDEWKSRTAQKIFREDGGRRTDDFFRDADTFHRLRQRAFQGNFPEGYRAALREYFDALSEKYLK